MTHLKSFTMAGPKHALFTLLAFVLQLQHIVTETVNSSSQSSIPPTLLLTASQSLQYSSVNQSHRPKEEKFRIRKCCGRGQVYNFNLDQEVADRKDRCVEYSITAHPPSSHFEYQQHIFFGPEKNWPPHYVLEDFEIETGFPSNCTDVTLLQPEMFLADVFYPLASGQLVVPRRFWLFDYKDYCIEDYFEEEDFSKGQRVAMICNSHSQSFPTSAIDDHGKLRLDFLQSTPPTELSAMAGRTVIRKCCDLNEVYSMQTYACERNQRLKTHYFDKLQDVESEGLFFHIRWPNCVYPSYQRSTTNFRLASNGRIEIETDAENERSESSDQPFATERCLEDTVDIDSAGLPVVVIRASFCTDQEATEFIEPEYPVDSSSFYEIDRNDSVEIKTPKCCPSGQVMDERSICQPLMSLLQEPSDNDRTISQALNYYLMKTHHIATVLVPNNSSLSCQLIRLELTDDSWKKLILQPDTENELSLSMHFYIENYWNIKLKPKPFCVDLAILKGNNQLSYHPYIYHCTSDFHVSIHYPILLSISAVALLLTFVIYFFVPTTGSAKLVTSGLGAGRRTRISTMAMMLTGRILLCHIFTLSLAFICLAIVQREHIAKTESSCVAIGYIIYGAFIASFSWLTVYCFDYYRIFSGSFKVSNEILFIPYSVFGWGVPAFAVTAALITQFQSTKLGVSETANPNIGLMNCWFPESGNAALIFFYAPVGSLLFIDIACFLSLLFNPNLMHCWKKNQGLAIRSTTKGRKKVSREQQDFKMALKLFFITGVPWVLEVAAWLPVYLSDTPSDFPNNSQIRYFFEVGNLLNSLRGVVIFVLFILLQRDVRHYLTLRMKRIFNKPSNAGRLSRANTDGGPSNSTQQSTNRRMSNMTSHTSTSTAVGGHYANESQMGFVEVHFYSLSQKSILVTSSLANNESTSVNNENLTYLIPSRI